MAGSPQKSTTLEVLRETGRNIVLAVLAYLLTEGVINTVLVAIVGDKLDTQQVLLVTGVVTFILRGIEKALHEADSRLQLPF